MAKFVERVELSFREYERLCEKADRCDKLEAQLKEYESIARDALDPFKSPSWSLVQCILEGKLKVVEDEEVHSG